MKEILGFKDRQNERGSGVGTANASYRGISEIIGWRGIGEEISASAIIDAGVTSLTTVYECVYECDLVYNYFAKGPTEIIDTDFSDNISSTPDLPNISFYRQQFWPTTVFIIIIIICL